MHLIRLLILTLLLAAAGSVVGEEEEKAEEKHTPLYHELAPSLVVNLEKGGKYARCDIQLMTYDEEQLEALELHAPALRNEFLFLIPEFDGRELKTPKGKEQLRAKALEASRKVMQELTGKPVVEAVYFTALFVQ